MNYPATLAVDLARAVLTDPKSTPDSAALAALVVQADADRRRGEPRTFPRAVPLASVLPRVEVTK
jgi:hypothetical protein